MTSKIVSCTTRADDQRPDREAAEAAVKTLLRYIGENPDREGLRETPARVVRAYDEFFAGYEQSAKSELLKTFEDIKDFDDIVLVKDIDFASHCEHHMVPIIGKAHVAYWPDKKVVGISKLARVVDIHARRLTSQENMTSQIAQIIDETLKPKGVAVKIEADHQCMSIRGVNKGASSTVTTSFSGIFKKDKDAQRRFLDMTARY
ncbi:MAG: GTP cyclohydrolase I FolE [Alphaproteobacteria bacterium]|nr:GTP cyclohydrolase I FolE [Alphaproteobacteria bacterium]